MQTTTDVKKVSIQVLTTTRDLLKSVGRKGETYDDLLRRLVNFYIKHKDLAEEEDPILPIE